jgi:hypothetical protein
MNLAKEKLYRHGDLVLRAISKAEAEKSGELQAARDLVVAGHDTAPHTIRGLVSYRMDGEGAARITTFVVHEDTTIEHAGRHEPGELLAGAYRMAALVEGESRSAVED